MLNETAGEPAIVTVCPSLPSPAWTPTSYPSTAAAARTIASAISAWPIPRLVPRNFVRNSSFSTGPGTPRFVNFVTSVRTSDTARSSSRSGSPVTGVLVPGTFTPAVSTQVVRKNSSNSRSDIRYFSTFPFLTLKSGGCAM